MVYWGAMCWVADGWDDVCPSVVHWEYTYGGSDGWGIVRWGIVCLGRHPRGRRRAGSWPAGVGLWRSPGEEVE